MFVRRRGTTDAPDTSGAVPTNERDTFVRTYSPRPGDIQRAWHVIDAEDIVLGRLAVQAATLLRGKHKPIYAPHVDTGDHVIVVNAAKLNIDPKKATDKLYHRHTGGTGHHDRRRLLLHLGCHWSEWASD